MDIDSRLHEAETALAAQRIRVENLKRDLESEEKKLEQMKVQLHALRAHKATQPNPISKLSTEALALILYESVVDARWNFELMLVCRKWRYIIETDPQMWNRIVIKYSNECWNVERWAKKTQLFAQKCIARSGAAQLDICLDLMEICSSAVHIQRRLYDGILCTFDDVNCTPLGDEDLMTNLDQLLKWVEGLPCEDLIDGLTNSAIVTGGFFSAHVKEILATLIGQDGEAMRRWESFFLYFPDDERQDVEQMWMSLRYPTPSLHTLILKGHIQFISDWLTTRQPTEEEISSRSIFPELPSLIRLEVDAVINWDVLSLQHTTIKQLEYSVLDYPMFLSRIRSFRNLRKLEISHLGLSADFLISPRLDTTISLPFLEKLKIIRYGRNIENLRFLLPNLVKLTLQIPEESARLPTLSLPMLSPKRVVFKYWRLLDLSEAKLRISLTYCVNHFRQTEEFSFQRVEKKTVVDAFKTLLSTSTDAYVDESELKYVSFLNHPEEEDGREVWTMEELKRGHKN